MVFDAEMIERLYAALPEKIKQIKNKLNRPLTLTEKILYAHLATDEPVENYVRAVDYVNFARSCGHARCNCPNGFATIDEFWSPDSCSAFYRSL